MSLILIVICTGLFDRIEAVAGNEVLLKSELDELSLFYGGQDTTRTLLRDEIVNRALIVKKAEQETIQVRDEEIKGMLDQRFEKLKEQLGGDEQLEAECKKRGITVPELRTKYYREIKGQLMLRRLLEKKSRAYLVITPTEVKRFYEQKKDSIAIRPGTIVLEHILLMIRPSKPEIEKAIQKISEVYDLLQRGGEFSILAKEFSDDPYSKNRGGLLGRVKRGETVEEFERVVFNLKPGEVSQPFQTRFGLHIAEVISKDEQSVLVRQILVAVKATKRDSQETYRKAERLIGKLKKGADFDSLATVYSDDPLAKQGSTLLGEFIEEKIPPVFKDKIINLRKGEISTPILTPYGYHIIRIKERIPRKILSYEEMRPTIESYLREQKFQEEYMKWAERTKKEVFNIFIDEN